MSGSYALRAEGINKRYPGVVALNNVDISCEPGEIIGLIGVNGAGKSTLMNIISGEEYADSGQFFVDGRPVELGSPKNAEKCGIALIHQEPVVFSSLSVAENLFILNLDQYIKHGHLNREKLNSDAATYLKMVSCELDPKATMEDVSAGDRQLCEIARALATGAKILLFDEPTSSLGDTEKNNLFRLLQELKRQGKSIIYITHFIDEVKQICDRVVALRDGVVVGRVVTASVEVPQLIEMMVGEVFHKVINHTKDAVNRKPILEVEGLTCLPVVHDVSFKLYEGEILGIWGLMGSGRTETFRAMLGLDRPDKGSVSVLNNKGEWQKMRGTELLSRVGYVTENRHEGGMFRELPIWKNVTIANLGHYKGSKVRFFLDNAKEKAESRQLIERLQIKAVDENVLMGTLSGGNQQKAIMARWIGKAPKIFLLDEPTRGIDVNSKNFIYDTIIGLAEQGNSLIIVSSEIEEILDLCDRVVIISDGYTVAEVEGENMDKQSLMRLCVDRGVEHHG